MDRWTDWEVCRGLSTGGVAKSVPGKPLSSGQSRRVAAPSRGSSSAPEPSWISLLGGHRPSLNLRVQLHLLRPPPLCRTRHRLPTAGILLRRKPTYSAASLRDFCSRAYTEDPNIGDLLAPSREGFLPPPADGNLLRRLTVSKVTAST